MSNKNPLVNTMHLLNIQSLAQRTGKAKMVELERHIAHHRPSIVCLTETWLTEKNKLEINGFNILRNDRKDGRRGGGTAIIIDRRYDFDRIEFDCTFTDIEVTAIRIICENHTLALATIYKSPRNKLRNCELDNLLRVLTDKADDVILAGDFNAHHDSFGSRYNSADGTRLVDFCNDKNLRIHRSQNPSRYTETSASYLDLIITSDLVIDRNIGHLRTIPFTSDHEVVVFKFEVRSAIEERKNVEYYNWSKTDIGKFQEAVDAIMAALDIPLDSNMSTYEIDAVIDDFNNKIAEVMRLMVPRVRIASNYQTSLDRTTLNLMKERDKRRWAFARKRTRMNGTFVTPVDIADLRLLKSELNNLSRIVKERISECNKKTFINRCNNTITGPNMFKNLKRVSCYKKRGAMYGTLEVDGRRITSRMDQANAFAEHYASVHAAALERGDPEFTSKVEEETRFLHNHRPLVQFNEDKPALQELCQDVDPRFTTVEEVMAFKKQINSKHSSGFDGISNWLIKRMPESFFVGFTTLFNHAINVKYFPQSWKLAVVIPIHKPGQPNDKLKSFRPISMISNISKLLERVLLSRIRKFTDANGAIPPNQFGFRPGLSAVDALMIVSTIIAESLNQGKPVALASLDTAKAFDTMWQRGLVYKLMKLGMDEYLVSIINSFLFNRHFAVQIEAQQSDWYEMVAGTPQGAVLAPVLFALFLHDMPLADAEEDQGPDPFLVDAPPEDTRIETVMYADDFLALAWGSDPNQIEEKTNDYLQRVAKFYDKWKIKANEEKSKVLKVYGLKKLLERRVVRKMKAVALTLNGEAIEEVDSMRYLGVTFDMKFNFTRHVANIRKRANGVLATFKHLFSRNLLNVPVRRCLYKVAIRTILAYGFVAWSGISAAQMELIRVTERKAIRTIDDNRGRAPNSFKFIRNAQLYGMADITRFDRHCVEGALGALEKASNHENPMLRKYFDPGIEYEDADLRFKSPSSLWNDGAVDGSGVLTRYHRRTRGVGTVYCTELGVAPRVGARRAPLAGDPGHGVT